MPSKKKKKSVNWTVGTKKLKYFVFNTKSQKLKYLMNQTMGTKKLKYFISNTKVTNNDYYSNMVLSFENISRILYMARDIYSQILI